MSLITLKNDDNQKPWNWRNYFREPLIIPPKSSISLQNCVVNQSADLDMEDDEYFFFKIGNNILNPTYVGRVDTSVDLWEANALAIDIKDELETMSGQPAFCDDVINSTNGWDCFYNGNSKKFTITASQNPLPAESECPQINPGNLNYWNAQNNDGTWATFRRTQTVAGGALPGTITLGGLWSEAVIPRNGGHILFQPSVNQATGEYPHQARFGISSTNPQEAEIGYYTSPAGVANSAPFGFAYFELYGPGVGNTRCRVMVNEGNLETDVDVVAKFQAFALDPANQYTFAMEWTTPYSLLFKYSTNYDPNNPATDYANATWTTMYDMSQDPAGELQCPTFQDNMSPVIQSYIRNVEYKVRGNFLSGQAKMGKWSWAVEGFQRTDGNFECGLDVDIGNDSIVGTYPNTFLRKDIAFLGDTADPAFTQAEATLWEAGLAFGLVDTQWGKNLGYTNHIFLLNNNDATYQAYNLQSNNQIVLNKALPTLHIQLTNFGIESKNGVSSVSNNVKDIAVIPLFSFNDDSDDTQLYFESQYENRINLNNLQELTLNQIDCMLTTDDNTPAKFLLNYSTIILKLHKGVEDGEKYDNTKKPIKSGQ